MALICSISNEVPECPVISPVSGGVFEKRLIEKFLKDNDGKDPINGEPLSPESLIEMKVPPFVKAKPPAHTSIPGILKSLQDEWDSVMLQSFTVRQQLQTARQELSHALYQHDAACRVIARLSKEVTAARQALATLKPQQSLSTFVAASDSRMEAIGISEAIHAKLKETANVLTQERKKKGKSVPEGLVPVDILKDFKVVGSHTGLHSASSPGILCLDLNGNTIVTGGNDKSIAIFDKESEQVTAILKGHSKKVVNVICHSDPSIVLSGSQDCTVRVWHVPSSQTVQFVRAHESPITGLSLHPTGDYVLSASLDHYWAFSDINTGQILAKVLGEDQHPLTSSKFHPDGLIFATGTLHANVKIWDLKEQSNVANFSGHTAPITAISFSENGYYLATAAEDSTVRLWDLRKLKNFKTIGLDTGFNITDLAFDPTGSYLGISGNDIRVYVCKTWNEVVRFNDHSAMGTGIRFGNNASFIATTSMDRSLKLYGPR